MTTYFCHYNSPVQDLLLTSDGTSLTGVHFWDTGRADLRPTIDEDWVEKPAAAPFAETRRQLTAYFNGTRRSFELPLEPEGTEFQKRVWMQLRRIPFGETISYGELARRIGNANASRAVGLANGRNPISIIVPCHRVIGSNGSLTGFGGGLLTKKALLDFEAECARGPARQFALFEPVRS